MGGLHRKETWEERAARKERERKEKKHETEEERHARKERERKERKEKEEKEKKKEEPLMELGDDFFAAEEARLEAKNKKRGDSDEEENGEDEQNESQEEEMDEDESMREDVKEEPVLFGGSTTIPNICVALVWVLSAFTLGGLYYFAYADVGIVNALKMLWRL